MTLQTFLASELESNNPGDTGALKIGYSPKHVTKQTLQEALEEVEDDLQARLYGLQDSSYAEIAFQPFLRFEGAGVTVDTDALHAAQVITIPGLGDTPFIDEVRNTGIPMPQRRIINIVGANHMEDDPDNEQITIDVSTPPQELTPIATTQLLGKARLSVDPTDPDDPVVVETSDGRMIDARTPLPHDHTVDDLPVADSGQEDPEFVIAANDVRLYNQRIPSDFSIALRHASAAISLIYICTSTSRPASPKHGQVIYETDTDVLMKNIGLPASPDWEPVGGGSASITVQDEGVTIAQRAVINVIGEAAYVVDDGVSKTELHIPGMQFQASGVDVGDPHAVLNITGATVTEDVPNSRVNVSIAAGSPASPSALGVVKISTAADDGANPIALGYNEWLRRDWKNSVRAATTQQLPTFTYLSGVITANANGALASSVTDGVTLNNGDTLVVQNETGSTQKYNGRYSVTQIGDATHPFILTRTPDFDSSTEVTPGIRVAVEEGATYGGKLLRLSTTGAITLDTTALSFAADTPLAASNTIQGIVTLSASGTNVAVADNDTRVPSSGQAAALLGTSGSPSNTNRYITNGDPRIPSLDENDALQGTTGAPSATNRYVTTQDPRLAGGGGSAAMRSLIKRGI